MKTFQAWARLKGSNRQFIMTEIKKKTKSEAKKWFDENGYEIDGVIHQV